ncbi:methyl-accepting chemotaxis protein [Natronobacterium gregoryi]|uniref:Methyl-accepting chemotaxis protein n=2 Tax=Natronobacterium gregoryi TaxID=44930 RepID=L0AG88_NATGS|nr:methyl-accepting chemotaxis protein [Natronobacterium gregoryi]AFZ72429.1 methyl-accepting chemotaxis protein [Natronobacterium gregoryi SP2]ELY64666.1 methyl-accepting chemotaxis sensory transducer [Natronobacterium gregoryi SP2]PLK19249.1 methyl-accepting chemotaxis protein [Natronobacterium gregoryi SP2]SFJ55823.1 methyl-accepting chemotaxis protein [Natronobacterium gregoryi]
MSAAGDETAADSGSNPEADRSITRFVPEFVRRSYRTKFVITILVVVLVISLVGAIGYVDAERTVESDAEQQLTATVDMHADSIDEWTISMAAHTRSVSSGAALAGSDAETAEAYAIQEQAKLPVDVRDVHVVDTNDERVLASTNGELRGVSVDSVDEPWAEIEPGVDLTAANDVWHSPTAYADDTVDDQVISFASPVENDEARIAVVVGTIEYRVDGLRQLHDDQETMIVDTDGKTVLASDELESDPDEEIVADLGATRDGTGFERDDAVVTAYAAMGDNEWVAVTTVPAEQAFAASNAVGWTLLSVIGTGLIVLLAGGVVLARQTVTPLEDLRNRARRMEEGDRSVDLETDRIDEVGRLYRAFDEMRTSLNEQITAAEAAKTEAETAQREAEEAQSDAETAREEAEAERERIASMMGELERVAGQYSETMQDAANGDLTVRATVDTDNEQMREIGEEFNAMLDELEDAIGGLKQFATDVAAASEQVTASSEEVKAASEQVSESVQEISDVADRQSDRLDTIQTEMSDLSASTEEIASTASEVAQVAERTVDASERGGEAAQDAIGEMNEVEAEAERAVETIRSLEAEVERIDELVDAIADVADQTSLLALNASIEAAAAGEEGDGFAVVADEVKSLSSDAKEAATEIEARIETIRGRTDKSVAVVEATSDKVREGTEAVEPAVEALEEIGEYAEETNVGVQEISAATNDQAGSAEEVVTAVDEIATSSEESAAEAGNVSAAAEEQTASLTEVTESVSGLADQAAFLSDRLEQFETERESELGGTSSGVETQRRSIDTLEKRSDD